MGAMTETKTWLAWLNLLFFWVLVTVIGGMIAYPAFLLVSTLASRLIFADLYTAILVSGAPLAGAIGGASVGLGQWLALRSWMEDPWRWALATFLGWTLAFSVSLLVFFWLLPDGIGYVNLIAPFALGGAVAGFIQSRILRMAAVSEGWWVIASAVGWVGGWVVALALASAFGPHMRLTPGASVAALGGLHGAFIGLESGVVLIFMIDFGKDKDEK